MVDKDENGIAHGVGPEDIKARDKEKYLAALRDGVPWDVEFGSLTVAERGEIRAKYFDANGQPTFTDMRPLLTEGDPIREQAHRLHGKLDVLHSLMSSTTDMAALEAEMTKVQDEIDTWVRFICITQPESVPLVIQRLEQEETR